MLGRDPDAGSRIPGPHPDSQRDRPFLAACDRPGRPARPSRRGGRRPAGPRRLLGDQGAGEPSDAAGGHRTGRREQERPRGADGQADLRVEADGRDRAAVTTGAEELAAGGRRGRSSASRPRPSTGPGDDRADAGARAVRAGGGAGDEAAWASASAVGSGVVTTTTSSAARPACRSARAEARAGVDQDEVGRRLSPASSASRRPGASPGGVDGRRAGSRRVDTREEPDAAGPVDDRLGQRAAAGQHVAQVAVDGARPQSRSRFASPRSASTRTTRRPISPSATARLSARFDVPTPPLPLVIRSDRAAASPVGGREGPADVGARRIDVAGHEGPLDRAERGGRATVGCDPSGSGGVRVAASWRPDGDGFEERRLLVPRPSAVDEDPSMSVIGRSDETARVTCHDSGTSGSRCFIASKQDGASSCSTRRSSPRAVTWTEVRTRPERSGRSVAERMNTRFPAGPRQRAAVAGYPIADGRSRAADGTSSTAIVAGRSRPATPAWRPSARPSRAGAPAMAAASSSRRRLRIRSDRCGTHPE